MNTSLFDIDLKMGFKCFYKYIIDGINHKLSYVTYDFICGCIIT